MKIKAKNAKDLQDSVCGDRMNAHTQDSEASLDVLLRIFTQDSQNENVSINPSLCECIGYLATQMRDWISSTFDQSIRAYDLVHQQAGILWRCYQEPCNQVHLCRLVKVDKNYVRFLIDDLEHKGLVYRFKNPKNRKENLICLTENGAEVCRKTFALMLKIQDDLLLSALSKDQVKTLHSLLLKVFVSINPTEKVN